ncbi:MAG: hypothetical protein Q9223_005438 [Gallowayella weberi]
MGRTDALISGSFALQYFERVTWPASDLDIFVESGENSENLCKYLAETEGYFRVQGKEERDNPGYGMISHITVSKLLKAVDGTGNQPSQIHVIITPSSPIHAVLKSFYTTVVVNVLTWNAAYSLFPLTTFIQYRGYMLQPMDEHLAPLVNTYTRRGVVDDSVIAIPGKYPSTLAMSGGLLRLSQSSNINASTFLASMVIRANIVS